MSITNTINPAPLGAQVGRLGFYPEQNPVTGAIVAIHVEKQHLGVDATTGAVVDLRSDALLATVRAALVASATWTPAQSAFFAQALADINAYMQAQKGL